MAGPTRPVKFQLRRDAGTFTFDGSAGEYRGRGTFSFTAKVEHIVAQRALIPELAAAGALFVVSAVES